MNKEVWWLSERMLELNVEIQKCEAEEHRLSPGSPPLRLKFSKEMDVNGIIRVGYYCPDCVALTSQVWVFDE